MSPQVTKSNLIVNLEERLWRTPDFDELRFCKEIAVFVYDDLKTGTLLNQKMFSGGKYLGEAYTLNSPFVMKERNSKPIVFDEKESGVPHGAIKGEAFLIGPQHILALDEHMETSVYTYRRMIKIILTEQQAAVNLEKWMGYKWINAFIYIGNRNVFEKQGGKLLSRSTRLNKAILSGPLSRPYYEWDTWELEWPFLADQMRGEYLDREFMEGAY